MSKSENEEKHDNMFATCLLRIGENIKKNKYIDLQNKKEVTVGRAPDVTVCLLSNMISRCHAIFKCDENGQWNVRDNKSLNGVYVNGVKLEPMCPKILKDSDVVQFGVAKSPKEDPEFQYRFYSKMKVKRPRPDSMDEVDSSHKRPKPTFNDGKTYAPQGTSKGSEWSPYHDYKEKMKKQEEEMAKRMKEYEEKLLLMQNVLKEKEEKQAAMKNELEEEKRKREENVKEMEETLKKKQEEMAEEIRRKEEEEAKMKEELENRLLEKEATLLEQLQAQKESLIQEKEKVEQNLKDAMEKAIEEKNKTLEEELRGQKEKLESVILQKETEQKMLEAQLNEVKEEKEKQTEAVLHAKQDILSNFAELMETELQCSICNELFVQATSLNCSHSFCALCIQQWMKVKKECAVCRAPVTNTMRAISLDSYIETMVSHLSDELKERRKQLVESRKADQLKFDEENKPKPPQPPANRGRARGRGGRRGGRAARGRGAANNPIVIQDLQNILATVATNAAGHRPIIVDDVPDVVDEITIGDDDDDDDNDDEDEDEENLSDSDSMNSMRDSYDNSDESDSEFIRGEAGAYYGGYGSCYRCGARGHWANGCPYR